MRLSSHHKHVGGQASVILRDTCLVVSMHDMCLMEVDSFLLTLAAKNAAWAGHPFAEASSLLRMDCAADAFSLYDLVGTIVPLLLRAVDSDDDARAVTAAIGGLTQVVQLVGAGPCQPHLAGIVEASKKILAGEAICQITVDSDLEDLEHEQDDQVGLVFTPYSARKGCRHRRKDDTHETPPFSMHC